MKNFTVRPVLTEISPYRQNMGEGISLSQQIPALKIADITRTVIRCFFPAVDVALQLPKVAIPEE